MKKFNIIGLSFVLILSFLLGARMILSGDFFYLFDQARDLLLVKDIVDTRSLALIGTHSGLGGFFHGPVWLYVLVPVFVVSNGDPFGLAYFFVGLQIVTVFVAYLVGAKLYGSKGGLLISLLIALSPITWGPVPNTIGVNAVPLVFLGLFYFLVKFLRGDANSLIFASFFTGFALQFETALPLVIIPSVIVVIILNKAVIKNLKTVVLSVVAFLLSVSTFILFDLRHDFLMTNAIMGVFSGGVKDKGYLELNERLVSHLNSLFALYKDLLFKQDPLLILLLVAIFAFGLFLFITNKKSKYKKEFLYLLFFPVLPFIFLILYPYQVWPEYIFGLIVPVAFAFYLAIHAIWKNIFGKILVILFFVITFLNVFTFIQNQYLQKYQQNNSSGSYLNQNTVVDWMYKDAGKGKFGYFVYTAETYTHGMDYLISWYGKNYPESNFESKKDSITYLILYPHMANDEGAYDFWKKNTLKTNGKVILTKKFKGGITVEKLLIDTNEPSVDNNYYQGLLFR